MEEHSDLLVGLWKFKDTVPAKELNAYAEELAKDDKYSQIYIRKVSKDQFGIGFTYHHENNISKKEFDELTDSIKDKLYKKFGVGLVGWDISNSVRVFKGF